ncbi:MAG: hypothetical protein ACT4OJ_00275, partial [Bacteroidota bacterium]
TAEISSDGKNFTELGKIVNTVPPAEGPAQTKEMGVGVKARTRFVRIRAVSGGKLPAWHESAGSPSHLFIDEVIIR